MNLTTLWPLALSVGNAIGQHCLPPMAAAAQAVGFTDRSWTLLLAAMSFAPDPISPARLRVRVPYTAPRAYAESLAASQRLGMLEPVGEDVYHLTDMGWRATRRIVSAAYEVLGAMAPLSIDQMEELSAYLHRLVLASLYADEPAGKWSIVHSRRTDPEDLAPPVIRIDQYLTDLAAFRDDAHLAAWKPHGVPGHGWEAFTLLWRGEAASLAEIREKLGRRGYSPEEYAAALAELAKRHWLIISPSGYRLTQKGRDLRRLAEDETDRVFYAPWTCLNGDEMVHLADLLESFQLAVAATAAA